MLIVNTYKKININSLKFDIVIFVFNKRTEENIKFTQLICVHKYIFFEN